MSEDRPLKSAYELAMERLKARDREQGAEKSRPLTPAQKQEIASLRQEARAKLAEMEILHRDALLAVQGDMEKIRDLDEKYRIDRERIESRLESSIARLKRGKPAKGKKTRSGG